MCSIYVYTLSVNDNLIHDKVVCCPSLKADAFTTATIDNIDQNPSSNTATSSFHGKAISPFQHPSLGKGDEREVPDFQINQKEIEKTAILLHRHKTCDLERDNHYPGT